MKKLYKATATIDCYIIWDDKDGEPSPYDAEDALGDEISYNGLGDGSSIELEEVDPNSLPAGIRDTIPHGENYSTIADIFSVKNG